MTTIWQPMTRRAACCALAAAGATVVPATAAGQESWGEPALDRHEVRASSDAPARFARAMTLTRTELPEFSAHPLPGLRHEASELSYRWWASRGLFGLGFGVGSLVQTVRQATPRVAGEDADLRPLSGPAAASVASATVLTLGMRYHPSEHSVLFADAAGVRSLAGAAGEPVVAKVGIELKAVRSQWRLSYGGLGLHLSDATRMTVRVRRGGMSVAMRTSF